MRTLNSPRSSRSAGGRARRLAPLLALLVGLSVVTPAVARARTPAPPTTADRALAARIQSRFDVLPVQNGIVLMPKARLGDVRSIELAGGSVAINGVAVTGGELRARLGADADLILPLTYLDVATRQTLFGLAPAASAAGETPAAGAAAPAAPVPSTPTPPEAPAPPTPPSGDQFTHTGDRVRIGGSVTVDRDEVVDGDVVVIGGTARIDGDVTGEVAVVGGTCHIGPDAHVHGDVTVVGGVLDRNPNARLDGKVSLIGFGGRMLHGRRFPHFFDAAPFFGGFPFAFIGLFATVFRIALLILLGSLVVLIAQRPVELIGARAAAEPWKSGLVGLAAELLFLPVLVLTVIILAVTIIGIPLLVLVPFAVIAVLLVFLVGFTGVAYQVGRWLEARLGWRLAGPYAPTIIGIVALVALTLAGRLAGMIGSFFDLFAVMFVGLGTLIEWAAWTTGFGAAVLVRFGHHLGSSAPAVAGLPAPAAGPQDAGPAASGPSGM
ncbi:MAG TPA: polymer-forming cytoskeletal protein [Vicinamibacterales bacterium]|nr:polymer-forming cytoskeletal protein [Vicinamibacterales bacterium]